MEQSPITAVVLRGDTRPVSWRVEAIDDAQDGSIYVTIFFGPHAKERAAEYAKSKYQGVEIRQ